MFLLIQLGTLADVSVFSSDDGKFGLIDENGTVIADAKYKKMVRLGNTAWIIQDGSKFGIMHNSGKIIVEPRFSHAERVLGKYVKFKKGDKYGIYDEMGFDILPVEYSSIDLLYGGMFVTSKNYMYGISDMNGQIILDNIFEDIYMPEFNKLVLVYNGETYEVIRESGTALEVPYDIRLLHEDLNNIQLVDITTNPIATTGYYSVTFTDYLLKLFSSISPAYEQTIDELMFSQGADTVNVIMKCGWIPKFPFIYTRKYISNVADPYNGPLSQIKKSLKRSMKN